MVTLLDRHSCYVGSMREEDTFTQQTLKACRELDFGENERMSQV
jgi:hypothetical protein